MNQRKQINVRLDDDGLVAIEDIRLMMRPIPTVSEVVRIAILNERDRLKRTVKA